MPTAPKPKSSTVWIWNKTRTDGAGVFRSNIEMIHYTKTEGEGPTKRLEPVCQPLTPGLSEVDREIWETGLGLAKKIDGHRIARLNAAKRLIEVDPRKMLEDDLQQAIKTTANKQAINDLITMGGKAGEIAAEVKRTWHSEERPISRKITAHLASYQRAAV